jgi:hypothetical protein
MPRKVDVPAVNVVPAAVVVPEETWTSAELLAVKHLGPGVIGEAKFRAVQAYIASSAGGVLGPATRG